MTMVSLSRPAAIVDQAVASGADIPRRERTRYADAVGHAARDWTAAYWPLVHFDIMLVRHDECPDRTAARLRQPRIVIGCASCLCLLAADVPGGRDRRRGYWDGGYTGNPAIVPLYQVTSATDLIVIGINPLFRDGLPRSARDIANRIDEISFNSTFMLELSAIAFIDRLLETGALDPQRFRPLLLHGIDGGAKLGKLGASSKMNNHPSFLRHLHDYGGDAADAWLKSHLQEVGKTSTVDLAALTPLQNDVHVGLVTSLQ